MAVATHIVTKVIRAQALQTSGQAINFGNTGAGAFMCGIMTAGSGMPSLSSTGAQFVADLFTTPNTNVELSYSGYARQPLTAVTAPFDGTLGVVDWSWTGPTWAQNSNDPGTGRWIFLYYAGVGAGDSTYPLINLIGDGTTIFSVTSASLTMSCPSGGLIQVTGGG